MWSSKLVSSKMNLIALFSINKMGGVYNTKNIIPILEMSNGIYDADAGITWCIYFSYIMPQYLQTHLQ